MRPGTASRRVPTVVGQPRARIGGASPTLLVVTRPRPGAVRTRPAPHTGAAPRATGATTIHATGTIRDTARAARGPPAVERASRAPGGRCVPTVHRPDRRPHLARRLP